MEGSREFQPSQGSPIVEYVLIGKKTTFVVPDWQCFVEGVKLKLLP